MPDIKNNQGKRKLPDSRSYHRLQMQRDMIVEKLRERGCRITKQRLTLIDIILEDDCSSCKEIFYKASRINSNIGSATVYRMVSVLEEIGAISRKNMLRVACSEDCSMEDVCTVVLDDNTTYHLSAREWNQVVQIGLRERGYLGKRKVAAITVRPYECGQEDCERPACN